MDSIGFYVTLRQPSLRSKRINIRHMRNSIFDLPDAMFVKNFRLNKPAFKYVLRELKRKLPPVVRSSSLTPEFKLTAFLRFLAEGGYQHGVGQDFNVGIAQSTMSFVMSEVLNILEEELCPKWITLHMTDEEKTEARSYYYRKCKIPGVVMCIDGSHIQIFKPPGPNAHQFLNRKGLFSLNAMVICDHKQRVRYVDAKYPGSSHDSLIWRNSEAFLYFKSLYENGDRNTRLLGDAGYPLAPWLITPFRNAGVGTPQSRFNKSHSFSRNVVERTFGVWKNWCRCCLGARQLHYSPRKAVKIINVSAALHNIRKHFKMVDEDVPDISVLEESEDDPDEFDDQIGSQYFQEGNLLRNQFLSNFQ